MTGLPASISTRSTCRSTSGSRFSAKYSHTTRVSSACGSSNTAAGTPNAILLLIHPLHRSQAQRGSLPALRLSQPRNGSGLRRALPGDVAIATAQRARRCASDSAGAAPAGVAQRPEASGGGQLLARGMRGPQRIAARDERARGQLGERAGLGEQEALSGHAAERQQCRDLRLQLDAFGDRVEAERLAERDDRPRQLRAVFGARQAADEGAIDLEDVNRKTMQIRQRGIAGAEIVDREAHAERLETVKALQVG